MESVNFVSPNIGMNNFDKQMMDDGLCNSNQRDNSSLYSFPGILHFLQAEWNKMENERAHWEIEKAELMAKIAFLQGEKKGQECLKEDLVRRIKMLEYALKQKNQVIMELKYGTSISNNGGTTVDSSKNNADDGNKIKPDSKQKLHTDLEKAKAASTEWRESRQRLRKFLQEVGFVDAMLDVRQFRLRSILSEGLYSKMIDEQSSTKNNDESIIDAEASALKTFDFLNQEKDQNIKGDECSNDVNHFDNKMTTEDDGSWVNQFSQRFSSKRNLDNDLENQLISGKNKIKFPPKRLNKKDPELQEILAQLTDDNLMQDDSEDSKKEKKLNSANNANDLDNLTSTYGLGDLACITVTNDMDSETDSNKPQFGSGANSNAGMQLMESSSGPGSKMDNSSIKDSLDNAVNSTGNTTSWTNKYTMRGHFDSVRCLSFYNDESAILSGSDDGTIKVWNFNKAQLAKKGPSQEIEAVQTMRGHNGSVISVQYLDNIISNSTNSPMAVSGGVDGSLRFWRLPNLEIDPYEFYDPNQNALSIPDAHTDPIWKVGMLRSDNRIFSVSPYHIKIWSVNNLNAISFVSNQEDNVYNNKEMACSLLKEIPVYDLAQSKGITSGRMTSATILKHNSSQLAASTSTGQLHIIDLQSGALESTIHLSESEVINEWNDEAINCIVSHPTLPLVFCAHEDHQLRTVDLRSNTIIHSMVVHQDSVSCVDLEEYGIYLLTGCHDGSMRLWDLEKRSCIQEMSCHRVKNNEAVNYVTFHPTQPFIASCGAEGIVKIYS